MQDVKWGVYLRQPDWSVEQIHDHVMKIEEMGYHGIYTNDHLLGFDKERNRKDPYLEAMSYMTMLLGWTKRIHVGHTVLCQSYRHPALLAKMVATIDYMSHGRFDLLLGAGWNEEEYEAYGLNFPSVKTRFEQLKEYVHIVRTMLDPHIENWSYKGKYWQLKDNRNFPKPNTKIPIHIGGTKPVITRLAAQIGDGYNTIAPLDQAQKMYQIYDEEVIKMGDKPNRRIKSFFGAVQIFNNEQETSDYAKSFLEKKTSEEKVKLESLIRNNLWGTPHMLADKFQRFINNTGVEFFQLAIRGTVEDPLTVFWDEIRPNI